MSTYTPPTFGAFGKSSLFQVYDKDSLDHTVKLASKNAQGVTFESGLVYAAKAQPRAYIKTNFGLNGYLVDAQVHTDASKATTLNIKKKNVLKNLPGVNAGVSFTSSEKDFSKAPRYGAFTTVSADYTRNNFAATAAVVTDDDSSHSVSASAAVGFEGFALGGDFKAVKTADSAFQAKSYNAGFAYTKKNYTAALVSDAKFEKLKATLLAAKVGCNNAFTFGAQAKVDLQAPKVGAPQREVILSVEDKVSAATTIKIAAVVTTGAVVASVEHKLANPQLAVSATIATQIPSSAFAPLAVSKFGVSFAFGDC